MTESNPAPAAPRPSLDEEYPKPPERLRQEEWFLMGWRVLLIIATAWAMAYAWIGLTWDQARLNELAGETIHNSLQKGVVVFLGIELAYYLYISSSFRKCREWGMIVWGIGLLAVILNLRAGIGV